MVFLPYDNLFGYSACTKTTCVHAYFGGYNFLSSRMIYVTKDTGVPFIETYIGAFEYVGNITPKNFFIQGNLLEVQGNATVADSKDTSHDPDIQEGVPIE